MAEVTPAKTTMSNHVQALDGLRGVAVLLVIVFHSSTALWSGKGWIVRTVGDLCGAGWVGVDIFFTLSGFLITGILLDTANDEGYFKKFYIRRSLRIFPLYYGVLLLLFVLTPILHFVWEGTAWFYITYLQNYISTRQGMTVTTPFGAIHLDHLWSLAVEEQFYLIWPLLIWLFRRRVDFIFIPMVLVVLCPALRFFALAHGVSTVSTYIWTPFRLDTLAWGALAALFVRRPSIERYRWVPWAVSTCGFLLLSWVLVKEHGLLGFYDAVTAKAGFTALAMLSSALIVTILQPGLLTALFSASALRWVGKLSYGIYVFHFLFIDQCQRLRYWVSSQTHSRSLALLAAVAASYIIGIGLAWLSYHFYERHWLRLKDVLARYNRKPVTRGNA